MAAICAAAAGSPSEAAADGTAYAVTAAGACETTTGAPCLFVAAATMDPRGQARGAMQLHVFGAQGWTLNLSPQRAFVDSTGPITQAQFEGTAAILNEAGDIVDVKSGATWAIGADGSFLAVLDSGPIGATKTTPISISVMDYQYQFAGTHEVGHWIGVYYTSRDERPSWLASGIVTVTDKATAKTDVEGQPDVAGLFRDTAEGETHAHGHLDFLKQVGDPATGFEARGRGSCIAADGRVSSTTIGLELDLKLGLLAFLARQCGIDEILPVQQVAPARPSRDTIIVGPDASR